MKSVSKKLTLQLENTLRAGTWFWLLVVFWTASSCVQQAETFNLGWKRLENSGTTKEWSSDILKWTLDGECVIVWLQNFGWLLKCISETLWVVLVKKHLRKNGVWMQESNANRFCIFVFTVFWTLGIFCRGSRLFFLKFTTSLQWPMELNL